MPSLALATLSYIFFYIICDNSATRLILMPQSRREKLKLMAERVEFEPTIHDTFNSIHAFQACALNLAA